ncbi:MAG: hypothetical protein KF772_04810 [Cryobacterium sp.]|nr:hypothetical protein [Cryobacterium sp.]
MSIDVLLDTENLYTLSRGRKKGDPKIPMTVAQALTVTRNLLDWFETSAGEPVGQIRSYGKKWDNSVKVFDESFSPTHVDDHPRKVTKCHEISPGSKSEIWGASPPENGLSLWKIRVNDGKNLAEERLISDLNFAVEEGRAARKVLLGGGDHLMRNCIAGWKEQQLEIWSVLPADFYINRDFVDPAGVYGDDEHTRIIQKFYRISNREEDADVEFWAISGVASGDSQSESKLAAKERGARQRAARLKAITIRLKQILRSPDDDAAKEKLIYALLTTYDGDYQGKDLRKFIRKSISERAKFESLKPILDAAIIRYRAGHEGEL